VIFSSRNHIKTTQEIVLFSPVFCPTIGGRFTLSEFDTPFDKADTQSQSCAGLLENDRQFESAFNGLEVSVDLP
jgi:hypothetical protein